MRLATLPIVLMLLGLLLAVPASAQSGYVTDRDLAARNLVESAMQSYRQGVELQDEELYWDSVDALARAFVEYPETRIARDNFLTAVEILCKKIGTNEAYTYALNMLEGYQVRYGDEYAGVGEVDQQLARDMFLAQVEHFYTYRHDYQEAARRFSEYYKRFGDQLTSSERARAKLMQARVERRMGDFAAAKRSYGVAEEASKTAARDATRDAAYPVVPLNLQRQVQLCEELTRAQVVAVGPHRVYGLSGVTSPQLQEVARRLEAANVELGFDMGVDPNFPLDIFVFGGERDLAGLTGEANAYVLAVDGELYVTTQTPLKPLLAQVAALSWRVRPIEEVPQVIAEGLPSAMGLTKDAAWRSGAAARAVLGKRFTPEVVLDPALYASLPDRSGVAAAFVQHLLATAGPDRFGQLFAGWETIAEQASAPVRDTDVEKLEKEGKSASRIQYDAMKRAFRSVMGQDFDTVWNGFSAKCLQVAQAEEAAFNTRSGGLRKASIVQDSPEAAVVSWVKAMQCGDTDAMLTLSNKALRQELSETFDDLKAQGNFDAVRLWNFAMTYTPLTPEVQGIRNISPVQREVQLVLKDRDTIVRSATLEVWEENGKWTLANTL